MRDFLIIFQQAFWTKAKTKSFIITTLLVAACFFLTANLPYLLDTARNSGILGDEKNDTIQIIDQSDGLGSLLLEQLEEGNNGVEASLTELSEEQLRKSIEEGAVSAYVVLNQEDVVTARYVSESASEWGSAAAIEQAVQSVQRLQAADAIGLSAEDMASLSIPAKFNKETVSETSKSEEELNQARGLIYILIFLIYFSVIYYSNMIAMEVATEKSSRVMEILISSVSPVKHMLAKIAGIGTLGLLQMMFFGISGYVAIQTSASDLAEGAFSFFGFSNAEFSTFLFAALFFLLGYFLYAVLAAFLGSMVSRTEDVQQLMLPMMFLIIIASFIAFTGIAVPEATFVTVSSYIPFFAPLVMFLRVGMLDIPLWEPVLSAGILIFTIVILGSFGARVYKGGVLMYGSSQSLKDIRKAIRLGNSK